MTTLWQFAEIDAVWSRLRPLTPYGRRAFERRQLITDLAELNRRYDRIDQMRALAKSHPLTADRVRFHLKRIPMLPAIGEIASAADLFLVKKFLANYRAIAEHTRALPWEAQGLLDALQAGGGDGETFYLADGSSSRLSAVRKTLREIDAAIQQARNVAIETLRTRYGLDFSQRDFLVIDSDRAAKLPAEDIFVEPFDSHHVIVRPVLPKPFFALVSQRDALAAQEQKVEDNLVAALCAQVRESAGVLEICAAAIESLDVSFAAADFAQSLELTRPILHEPGKPIHVEGGRLIPLEENCAAQSLPYTPLTVHLGTPHALLHGANMSGKSVVLKSIASLQLLAQLGVFVPARRFSTVIFDQLHFVGAIGSEEARGLSSFGHEMVALQAAIASPGGSRLFVVDEFARTTSSREAAALIAALLSFFDATAGTYSLLATHYSPLPRFARIETWCMKGLDWPKLKRQLQSHPPTDLRARVQIINRCVAYEITPQGTQSPAADAIGIAEILGLDKSIIEFARGQLAAQEGRA